MERPQVPHDPSTAVRARGTDDRPGRRRRGWRLLTTLYGVAWAVLVATYLGSPTMRPWLWSPIGLLGVCAVLVGLRLHRPSSALPWVLVASALATFVLGDTTYNILTAAMGRPDPVTSLADFFYLLTYPVFAGALVALYRRIVVYRDGAVLLDSLIVSAGVALLVWVYWIGTAVTSNEELGAKLVYIAYPVGDVLLLAMLVRLLLSLRSRPTSLLLLTSGTACLLAVDTVYGFVQVSSPWSNGSPVDIVWFVVYGLWGAAALHPSMRELTEPQAFGQSAMRWPRLALIGAASLIAPLVLLERSLQRQALETGGIAVFSTLLFSLVLTRLAVVLRQQKRSMERERALRQVSGDLARATTRTSIKAVVDRTMPRLADTTMTSWLVLRDEFEAASGAARRSVDAYGHAPRGRVFLPQRPAAVGSESDGSLVLMVPVAASDESELMGLIGVTGPRTSLESVGDAFETLASQVALALARVTLDNELVQRRSEEHFRALIQNATDVIIVLDDGDRVSYATPSVQGMLGEHPEAVVGRSLLDLLHVDSRRQAVTALSRLRERGHRAQDLDDWQVLAYDGRSVEVEVFLADLRDVDVVDGVVLTMRDVTLRRQLERELTHRASHDPLTGLANRVLFNDRIEIATRRARRGHLMAAVLFCDLDEFKDVNDLLGHVVGDQLLLAVARRISEVVRPADIAARLGGDEFAVLMEDVESVEEIEILGERLVACLGEPFDVNGELITVSASVGVCTSNDGADATELLRFADLALYAAKEAGKQTWRMFVPAMQAAVSARIELRVDIEAALAAGEFCLAYQPLVSMPDNYATGVEALVRWEHPRRGRLMPGDFLTVAEDTGLIVPLGAWVLRTALLEARDWRLHDGTRPVVHVNVSARQLQVPGFPAIVRQALTDADFPAEALVLELTESLFLDHDAQSNALIAELKALGVRLAMDDFGTGYSSLGYLRDFPVDLLKIDKAFVRDLALPGQGALVDAIVRIASVLGLDLIAEGVEDAYQRKILLDLGCGTGQGFLFSRPVGADHVARLLDRPLPLPTSTPTNPSTKLLQPTSQDAA